MKPTSSSSSSCQTCFLTHQWKFAEHRAQKLRGTVESLKKERLDLISKEQDTEKKLEAMEQKLKSYNEDMEKLKEKNEQLRKLNVELSESKPPVELLKTALTQLRVTQAHHQQNPPDELLRQKISTFKMCCADKEQKKNANQELKSFKAAFSEHSKAIESSMERIQESVAMLELHPFPQLSKEFSDAYEKATEECGICNEMVKAKSRWECERCKKCCHKKCSNAWLLNNFLMSCPLCRYISPEDALLWK